MCSDYHDTEEEELCIGCLEPLCWFDHHPNGDKVATCIRCRAEESHDFDREPNVMFDRRGIRVSEREYEE